MQNHDSEKIKLVVLGSPNTGKSSILNRYINAIYDDNSQSTIGASFFSKKIYTKHKTYIIEIWDTAGQERYESLIPMYYRGSHVIFVVYDITSHISFNKATEWVKHIKEKLDNDPIIVLIGNKVDLEKYRKVQSPDAGYYADNNGILFYETSAKTNTNINNIFNNILDKIQQKNTTLYIQEEQKNIVNINDNSIGTNIYNCISNILYSNY